MLNLQSNALKFTEKGRVVLKAKLEVVDDEKFIELSCSDTGIGIKEEDQKKLFKMFGYLKDHKQMNVHGIGLGLNLSKKIIEQFDGTIEVKSKYGKGTTFTVRLKLYDEEMLPSEIVCQNEV